MSVTNNDTGSQVSPADEKSTSTSIQSQGSRPTRRNVITSARGKWKLEEDVSVTTAKIRKENVDDVSSTEVKIKLEKIEHLVPLLTTQGANSEDTATEGEAETVRGETAPISVSSGSSTLDERDEVEVERERRRSTSLQKDEFVTATVDERQHCATRPENVGNNLEAVLEILNALRYCGKPDKNRHTAFFESLLPSLAGLSDAQTLYFQSRILSLLMTMKEVEDSMPTVHQASTSRYYPASGVAASVSPVYAPLPRSSGILNSKANVSWHSEEEESDESYNASPARFYYKP